MSVDLDRRLAALADAAEIAHGRLDADRVARARAVVGRAGKRLGLGIESTVVALAGPTGAGKSTLFNALAGAELVEASRRRPTTGSATAAAWGDGGDPLLEWLDVPRRHRLGDGKLGGLLLLDLPDFDSVEVSHRLEVDRIVELADLVVWVVDPQKYADAAWHDRYLRRLSGYGESMVVALNQADVLTPEALAACEADLRRLLREDGLASVPVLAVSALRGDAVDELRAELARRVRARDAAVARLGADVTTAVAALEDGCGERSRRRVENEDRDRLVAALADAAGVPTVTRAVAVAHRRRGALATGWPFVRWIRGLRPDPLRRLRLSETPTEATRTSLPGPSSVQRSQVSAATRRLAARASDGLPPPWPGLARAAATVREDDVADRLDRAVAGADLHVKRPLWWPLVGFVQTILAAVVLVATLWLLGLVLLGFLHLDEAVPLPDVGPLPVPTALLIGGVVAGLLLSFLAGLVNGVAARRRARAAECSLRARVEDVADELVVSPVESELAAYERLCELLETARGRDATWLGRAARRVVPAR